MKRFRAMTLDEIYSKPSPLEILFCWVQLGDAEEIRSVIAEATKEDEVFLNTLSALRGWSLSSIEGVKHPLSETYVESFMSAEKVRGRLLVLKGNPRFSDAAEEMLREWSKD